MKRLIPVVVAALVLAVAPLAFGHGKHSTFGDPESVKWFPMDAKNPDSPQIGVAHGDPGKGPASVYLKLKGGSTSPAHSHKANYTAILLKGEHKHWDDGHDKEAQTIKVGGSWFQPGGAVHVDHCVGPDECLLFITNAGKFTFDMPKAKK